MEGFNAHGGIKIAEMACENLSLGSFDRYSLVVFSSSEPCQLPEVPVMA